MKAGILGLAVTLLILASAWAHALIGWPTVQQSIGGGNLHPDLVAALAIGWYFGSASMLAFGLIVGLQAIRRLRHLPVDVGSLWVIAIVYVFFGAAAFVLRNLNPHFLIFVVTGVLTATFAFLCARFPGHGSSGKVPST